jgi:SAM-dependent methyltransferase
MNWRVKCLVHWLFSLPGLRRLYPGLKLRLSLGTVRRDLAALRAQLDLSRRHLYALERFGEMAPPKVTALEFGAGRDLANPLNLWALGVERQIVLDQHWLLQPELVARAAGFLRREAAADLRRRPGLLPAGPGLPAVLREDHGIRYLAPADARRTGLPAGSVHLVSTVNTLEHIPPRELAAILGECRRVLAPGGVVSMVVDYSDHYAHGHPGMSPYHFLRYSPGAWRLHNPPLHHQNRLRHADYARLFAQAGLELRHQQAWQPPAAASLLAGQPLAAAYASRPRAELAPTSGWWVLVKPGAQACAPGGFAL